MSGNISAVLTNIKGFADNAGASHSVIMTDEKFIAHKSVLASCAENICGNYGRCWTCPPSNGTFEELSDELSRYNNAVLIQNILPLKDSYDIEGMQAAMITHNDMIRNLGIKIRNLYPDMNLLVLGCGGCGYCESCTCPDHPCASPENSISSVEGYGMDVRTMVHAHGLKYINGVNTVSYVGLILVD